MFLERVAMGARAIFPLASVSLARREKTEKSPLLPHIPIWMLPNWEEKGGKGERGGKVYSKNWSVKQPRADWAGRRRGF